MALVLAAVLFYGNRVGDNRERIFNACTSQAQAFAEHNARIKASMQGEQTEGNPDLTRLADLNDSLLPLPDCGSKP